MFFLPPEFSPNVWQYLAITMMILAGEGLRIWGVGTVGSVTRTRGDHVPQLVHSGPYRYTRNPLYIGNVLLYAGCGLLFGFITLSVILTAYACIQYHYIVQFEEFLLQQTFGEAFDVYASQVPRWWIAEHTYSDSGHGFSLRKALQSERSTFISMSVILGGFAIKTLTK